MTIAFPRPLPDVSYSKSLPELVENIKAPNIGGKNVNFTRVSKPFWKVDIETDPLNLAQKQLFDAWIMSMRGGLKKVLFVDPQAGYPLLHYNDNTPAQTNGDLTSIANGNELAISNADPALSLSEGDYISLSNGDYSRHMVTEVTSNAAVKNISVEPLVPLDFVAGSTSVIFENPPLLMRLVPNSYRVSGKTQFVVSFTLQETR